MNPERFGRRIFFSALSGILSGGAAAWFLISLNWVTQIRDANPTFIWALPLAGLCIGWMYRRWGREADGGSHLILEEIHDPRKTLPVSMAPLIWLGTLLTHLFGGSAGREGTVVQLGASLSDQLTRFFKIDAEERKILLVAGAGAGFGAAIGAPWAGVVFGMEVIQIGKLRLFAWLECSIASFLAYGTAVLLQAPHSHFPTVEIPEFHFQTILWTALLGLVFGLAAQVFVRLTHVVERISVMLVPSAMWRPFFAGLLLVGLYSIEGSYRYVGLGIPFIQDAFSSVASFLDPAWKTFFTAVTVGSGFKGGEFVPLVFIGATLGSALSLVVPIALSLASALGFAAVFAGAANTPIACSLMAVELFGPRIAIYAVIACFFSYYFSGHQGIYKSQKVFAKKHHLLRDRILWLGELPQRFAKRL